MRRFVIIAALLFCATFLVAQGNGASSQSAAPRGANAQQPSTKHGNAQSPTVAPATPADTRRADEMEKGSGDTGNSVAAEEARASNAAAGEDEGGGENATFRESPSVKWLSKITGIPLKSAYWVFVALNFIILAYLIYLVSKTRLPAMFRSRTEVIRKSLDEAQRSSADANRRLTDIEARLSRLDTQVAEMRAQAEREAAAEEERIRAAGEQDKIRIVQAAQTEIEAVAKNARRDLKSYAADLAVALAEKRIQVDPATDQQLVRSFTDRLGANNGGGKDGR